MSKCEYRWQCEDYKTRRKICVGKPINRKECEHYETMRYIGYLKLGRKLDETQTNQWSD